MEGGLVKIGYSLARVKKLHPRYYPHLAARHVAKFNKATLFGFKVLAANTLHFKPIFHQFLKEKCKKGFCPR